MSAKITNKSLSATKLSFMYIIVIVQFITDCKNVISLLELNTFRPYVPNAHVSATAKNSRLVDRYHKRIFLKLKTKLVGLKRYNTSLDNSRA